MYLHLFAESARLKKEVQIIISCCVMKVSYERSSEQLVSVAISTGVRHEPIGTQCDSL